ncbi:MAG: Calx-beta domain-containing protein, partial [Acidobacteriota bacterium]
GFMQNPSSGSLSTLTIQVEVTALNSAPVIESLTAEQSVLFPGQSTILHAVAYDPEGDPISFSWSTSLGAVTALAPGEALYEAPVMAGAASVVCTVTDSLGASSTAALSISVTEAIAERKITSGLLSPQRVSFGPAGELFVADPGAGGIVVTDLFSDQAMEIIRVADVSTLAADWQGFLVVGGKGGARVIDSLGEEVLRLDPADGLFEVADVASDPTNRRYGVLYKNANRVVVFGETGSVDFALGSPGDGPGELMSPLAMAFGPAGEIVVADTGHGLIQVFDPSGGFLRAFGGLGGDPGQFTQLQGVAVGPTGLVYATDAFQSRVQVFTFDGVLREAFGAYGDEPGQLKTPIGLEIASAYGRLAVTSLNSSSVHVFELGGTGYESPFGSLSPAMLGFADLAVGMTSSEKTVSLTNSSARQMVISNIAVSGEFTNNTDCGSTLEPGDTCFIGVAFAPTTIGQGSGVLTIESNAINSPHICELSGTAVEVTLVVDDVAVTEGDEQSVFAVFPVDLNVAAPETVEVDWRTENGDAVAGKDFSAASGTVLIPSGSTTGAIWVEVLPDMLDEHDEDFSVWLTDPVNAVLGVAWSTGTILDNDPISRLSATDVVACEKLGGLTVDVVLDRVSGCDIAFDWATRDITALAGQDYTAASGTAFIPRGSRSAQIPVEFVIDSLVEDDEIFALDLFAPVDAVLETSEILITITEVGRAPGDLNRDCLIDAADLAEMILVLTDPGYMPSGDPDCNSNGVVDDSDLECIMKEIFR